MLINKIWQLAEKTPGIQSILTKELNISPTIAQILANRGITSVSEAQLFLNSELSQMHDPLLMKGMATAVERILLAREKHQRIAIYGDYDVDGITSTSVLMWLLRKIDCNVEYYIPDRMQEGYGPNRGAFQLLKDQGVELIVTVDCGISALPEVEFANEIGLDVIVTDHHQPPEVLPPALSVINPKQEDCEYPFKHLAGVGVAFKLGQAVLSKLTPEANWWEVGLEVLDLVCLGTIADIVPLQAENRIFVKHGLQALNETNKPGLKALIQVAGLQDKLINSGHVGFMLAPRLNAAGRLGDAKVGVHLLTCTELEEALPIAQQLNAENEQRQAMELEIFTEAVELIERDWDLEENPVLVLAHENWHTGVIGIVASRLVEKHYRPTIMLSYEGEFAKGSCRSISGLDMYEALRDSHDLLEKYGGHKQAAGLTIRREHIAEFTQRINQFAKSQLQEEDYIPKVRLDGEIDFQEISMRFVEEMQMLAPFGYCNPEPVLACRQAEVVNCQGIGKDGSHLKLKVKGGMGRWDAIGFKMGEMVEHLSSKPLVDLAVTVEKNEWNGRVNLQLHLKDIKLDPETNAQQVGNQSFLDKLFAQAEETLEDDYYRGIDDREEFYTKVAGVTFENRQEIIQTLHEGEQLSLVREPSNRFDPNAIRVETQDGQQIGFLNARLAKHLAPTLDRGEVYEVVLSSLTGGQEDKNWGVNILVSKANLEDEAAQLAALAQQREKLGQLDDHELLNQIRQSLLGDFPYRDKQREAITALMQGQRILAIFGTGRGKSAVFQSVAAFKAIRHQQTTIIIYPLRALVNDQFAAMQKKLGSLGLRVYRANGSISEPERIRFFQALEQQAVDVVLTTPEFLHYHVYKFNQLKNRIGLFVADESHHIGMAGSHRPAYSKLGWLINQLGSPPVAAVTATAKDEVAQAILQTLAIQRVIVDPHVRENLDVIDARGYADKPKYLRELVTAGLKTIIYVNSRQQSIELARYLREVVLGLRDKIAFYNAGLTNEQRVQVEQLFRQGNLNVVVTTSAFGEGIDIPDVEHVVLYHLNFNFTEFNQQSGRGGRDGRPAKIHLLFGEKDVRINEFILDNTAPGREFLGKFYLILRELAQTANPVQLTNGELAEIVQSKVGWTVRESTISVALSIFEELGLMDRETMGRQRYLFINPPPEQKLDLHKSLRYSEGLYEKAEFDEFQKTVFKSQPPELLKMINQPIYPQNLGVKEY